MDEENKGYTVEYDEEGYLVNDDYRIVEPKFIADGELPSIWVIELSKEYTDLYHEEENHGSFIDWLFQRLEKVLAHAGFSNDFSFDCDIIGNTVILTNCEYEEEEEEE